MPRSFPLSRSLLLVLCLLSSCAAGGAKGDGGTQTDAQSSTGRAYGAFLEGKFADSKFDLARAAEAYRAAAAADPTNRELHERAFITSLMAGDPEVASLAAGAEPNDQVAMLFRINEAARAGRWKQAIAEIRALPDQGVMPILAPLLRAWAEQGAGQTKAALAVLAPYLSGPEARGIDVMHTAMIADLAGENAIAAKNYAIAAQAITGPSLSLARALASWQARQGEVAKANATLKALAVHNGDIAMILPDLERHVAERVVANPTDGMAEAYLAVGASLRQQNVTDLSILMLRFALELRPDFTPARLLLADIFDTEGRAEAALAALPPAASNDPLAGLIDLRRASLLDDAGRKTEALSLLDRLAARYPTRPEPLAMKGDLLRGDAEWNAAIDAYSGAIARVGQPGPNEWALYYDRGIAYDQVHEWPRAEADFETALRLQPNQPYVLNYLGYSWAVRGQNLAKARKMIAEAVKLRPDDGAIMDSMGYVMLREGDTASALHWLLKAVGSEPDDPTINGHLGDAYWAAGNRLAAHYQWGLALSMHPNAKEAAELRSKLGRAEGAGRGARATGATGATAVAR